MTSSTEPYRVTELLPAIGDRRSSGWRRRSRPRRHHVEHHDVARAATAITDVGSRQGDGSARRAAHRHGSRGLLRKWTYRTSGIGFRHPSGLAKRPGGHASANKGKRINCPRQDPCPPSRDPATRLQLPHPEVCQKDTRHENAYGHRICEGEEEHTNDRQESAQRECEQPHPPHRRSRSHRMIVAVHN